MEKVVKLVWVAALLLVAVPVHCSDGSWSVNGQTYTCYRANLHVHTLWSASKHGERDYDLSPIDREWDHARCPEPDALLAHAAGIRYDIIGFSDHCLQIDPWEWGVLGWEGFPAKTILGCAGTNYPSAREAGGRAVLAIAGFEWTPSDSGPFARASEFAKNTGHVNVFYPADHAARNLGDVGPATTGKYPVLYARNQKWGAVRFGECGTTSTWAQSCPDLPSLYTAMVSHAERSPNVAPVAQFNHSAAMNQGEMFYGGHFDNFRYSEAASNLFRLFEMAITSVAPSKMAGCAFGDCEPLYQEALRAGWRLAPTIGMDNADEDLPGPREGYTGVWARGLSVTDVFDAMRSCRVFATQIPGLALQFDARDGKRIVPMGTGPDEGLGAGDTVTFRLLLGGDAARTTPYAKVKAQLVRLARGGAPSDPLGGFVNGTSLDVLLGGNDSRPRLHLEADGPGGKTYSADVKVSRQAICYYAVGDIDGKNWISAPIWVAKSSPTSGKTPLTSPIFVLDRSGSMSGVQKQLEDRATDFVDCLLARVSRMAVINFEGAGTATVDAGLTSDKGAIVKAIRQPSLMGGSTAIWDAVMKAIEHAQQAGEKAIIILLTDGGENSSRTSLGQAIARAQERGVPCLAVGFCNGGSEEEWLKDLAKGSGGAYVRLAYLNVDEFVAGYLSYAEAYKKADPKSVMPPIF